jgi:lysophospholipase L1-like esterase
MRWRDYVKGTRDKGPEYANYSGWRVGQVLEAMDDVLEQQKPEAAIIMVGTNDISGGRVPDGYRKGLEEVVRKCVAARCVPILNTIPPRRGHDKAVADANEIIRDIARQQQVPLADFHAECLRVRPGNSWDGTIISRDGVHPSGGESNDYSDENLKNCGYALRNWVNFLVYRQLYFHVLQAESTNPPTR